MKLRTSLTVLASVTSILAMGACSTGSTSGGGASVSAADVDESGALAGMTVTYVDGVPGNTLADGIAQGLASALNDQGAELVRVFQTNAQNQIDLSVANQRIQEAIAADVDAIVVFPLDANAVRPGVQAARDAGIPIFIFQDLADLDVNGKVAFPDEDRGRETGEALAELLGGSGTATVLSGVPTDNVENAVAGAVDGLQSGGLTLVGNPDQQRNLADDAPGGQTQAQAIFAAYPDLRGLLVYNAASATGAVAAARQAGLSDQVQIAVMAGDDTSIQQLRDGEVAAVYDLNALEYGKTMADLVTRALGGEDLENEVVAAPSGTVYTTDNVSDYVPWDERQTYVEIPTTY